MSDGTGAAARTAALQVCGRLGERAALPAARRVAEGSQSGTALRLAAVAAVAAMGGSEDMRFLQTLATTGNDAHVRRAAQSALERLRRRIAEGGRA